MAGLHLALSTFCAALWFAAALSVARVAGEKLATERFSPVRFGLWLALLGGGTFVLSRLQQPLLFGILGWLLASILFLGTTIELRGSPVRRRGAVAELYVLALALAFLLLRSRGMLSGASASPSYAFALQVETSELALPALAELAQLSKHGFEAGSAVVYAVSHQLGTHLFAATALSTFACAAFAAAYLADKPLSAPGVDLLPMPAGAPLWVSRSVSAIVFVALSVAAALLPVASSARALAALAASLLLPFYVAEAAFLLHRWLKPLRVRTLLLVLLFAFSLLWPALVVILAALGVLAQLLGLRELVPFNRLADAPLRRPPLAKMVGWVAGLSLLIALLAGSGYRSLHAHSPKLDARSDLCGGLETAVSWSDATVAFSGGPQSFAIDIDETPLPAGSNGERAAAQVCERVGKRLCTLDEWYTACLCTYPVESETGMKLSANHALAARAQLEAASPPARGTTSTLGEGKQSEVRALLTMRSEVVANPARNGVMLAGPTEAMSEPWTSDCRYTALISARALADEAQPFVSLRCCSADKSPPQK